VKIAILGYGKQGKSAYDYWKAQGADITVCDVDTSIQLPNDVKSVLGNDFLKNLDKYDLIVRSPIIYPPDIVKANNPEILSKVTTPTNEFFLVCPTKNIVGVTGTKGKGTTSTLITKMLEAGGKKVHLGGNIGISPLDLLKNNISTTDWVVLELANFQLIDLKYSPAYAVCLMVAPEHLNWHQSMDEYIKSKQQLFAYQSTNDIAVYYSKNEYSTQVIAPTNGKKIPYFESPGAFVSNGQIVIDGKELCSVGEVKLLGAHNLENICAAVTLVWQVNKDANAIKQVITSFTGLPHRLELVKEFDGVKYYDDSFGTTPETAIVAMKAFSSPKIMILGGSDKGSDYEDLVMSVLEDNVRGVVTIGNTGPTIAQMLETVGFHNVVNSKSSMKEIVDDARKLAEPGDIVLLSTGCASFGLFKDYEDRGNQFKQVVNELS